MNPGYMPGPQTDIHSCDRIICKIHQPRRKVGMCGRTHPKANTLRPSDACVSKCTIIGSDNGLSPGRRHAIICTNAGILLTGPWWKNFSEILIKIYQFSFKKCIWKCMRNGSHFVGGGGSYVVLTMIWVGGTRVRFRLHFSRIQK